MLCCILCSFVLHFVLHGKEITDVFFHFLPLLIHGVLKQREQALKQYCADEGLDCKNDRTAVVGYGRSTAAKASAAAKRKLAEQTRKRLDKAAESGIIQEKIRLYNIHNMWELQSILIQARKKLPTRSRSIIQKPAFM